MKLLVRFFAGLFTLGLGVRLAGDPTPPSPLPHPANPESALASGFSEPQILEAWGWIISQKKDVADLDLSETELATFLRGATAGFRGQPAAYDLGKILPDVEQVAKAQREKRARALTEKNEADARIFFSRLDQDPHVGKLPDGLRYEIVQPGQGPAPKPTQTVNVHYLATLIDGTEFMQMGPYDVVMVPNQSLPFPGWIEGLQKIGPGGVIKFYIPPPLPENEAEKRGIPPGSTMIYEVELLSCKDTSPGDLADSLAPPPPEPETALTSGYSESQIIETWGWEIAAETPASGFGWGETEISPLVQGLGAGVKGRPPPYDLGEISPEVARFVAGQEARAQQVFKQKQLAAAEAFFAGLRKNPHVVELPSGLRYEILQPGHGSCPQIGQTVTITFVGRRLDGKVFDRTEDDGPREVPLDHNPPPWLVPGWSEGLQKINKGGKIRLFIPSSLGYGSEFANGVPPDSTLIMEIALLDIQPTPATGQ